MLTHKDDLMKVLFYSIFMFVVYLLLQVQAIGGFQNLDVWFEVIPKTNLFLLIITSLLFGLLLSLQIHNYKHTSCSITHKTVSASSGGIGALVAFLVPACPACLSVVALLLPAATAISLITFLVEKIFLDMQYCRMP